LTFTFLRKINCFFPPKKIIVKSFLKYSKLKSRRHFAIHNSTLSIVPIKLVLKKFLEMPMIFLAIMKHIEKCNKSLLIKSIMKSHFWKTIFTQADKIIFPLVLYFDDIEINNPLRAYRIIKKIRAVYCSIPILGERNERIRSPPCRLTLMGERNKRIRSPPCRLTLMGERDQVIRY